MEDRITEGLRDLIVDRMRQQQGRARTVLGPEYAGRLRDAGLAGLADSLERSVGRAIAANAQDVLDRLGAATVILEPPGPTPAPPPSSGRLIAESILRVARFAAGDKGGGTGMGAWIRFPGQRVARLVYRMTFPTDFDFGAPVNGMKAPGLGGGSNPTGGDHKPDGLTARLQLDCEGRRARVTAYPYSHRQPAGATATGGYGYIIRSGGTPTWVEAGGSYLIDVLVDLGTFGRSNGRMVVKVDDVVAVSHDGIEWLGQERDAQGRPILIDTQVIQAFFGGNKPSPKTQSATYGPFAVYAG